MQRKLKMRKATPRPKPETQLLIRLLGNLKLRELCGPLGKVEVKPVIPKPPRHTATR